MKVILDTHVWLWWLLPDSPLPDRERKALDRIAADKGIFLPAICPWEAQMLYAMQRIELPGSFATWLRRATAPDILTVLPLSADIVIAVHDLPPAFHGDPADRMIVATCRTYDLPLVTYDDVIRRSRLVKLWKL